MKLLPISVLSACFKGTSSANTAVKVNTVQRRGFLWQGEREEADLLTASLPRWLRLLRCTVQCEDTSRHNLEQTKYMPGKIIEMVRIILFSCSHSCTPHAQLQCPGPQEAQ